MLSRVGTSYGDLCARVLYRKLVRGRTYPVAARTGPYYFAEEVYRVDGKLVSKYVGIVRASDGDVIEERGGEGKPKRTTESEEIQQKLL